VRLEKTAQRGAALFVLFARYNENDLFEEDKVVGEEDKRV
jgi:hypothetical protein